MEPGYVRRVLVRFYLLAVAVAVAVAVVKMEPQGQHHNLLALVVVAHIKTLYMFQ
jgi:hypothetical protein